jgi:ArsR family transcriptional regulator
MDIEQITNCMKALSDPTRMKLLNLIRKGTQCNCEFCDSLGLQPNLISHHLRILKNAGLVRIEKDPLDSRWIYYSINEATFLELRVFFNDFLDPQSIQPRSSTCGPVNVIGTLAEKLSTHKN